MPVACYLFAATLASFMLISAGAVWQLFFYLVFIVGSLVAWFRQRTRFQSYALARLWPIWALLIYCVVVAMWLTQHSPEHALKVARNSLTTATFIALTVLVFVQSKEAVHKVLTLAAIVALVAAVATLVAYFLYNPGVRLRPLGQASHSISGASVYGVLGLIAVHLLLIGRGRGRVLHLLAIAAVSTVILLCQSRGELLAFFISCVAAVFIPTGASKKSKATWWLVGGFLVIPIGLVALTYSEYLGALAVRGFGGRPLIWAFTMDQVQHAPWFGHGYFEKLELSYLGEQVAHPHNIFLSTLYYSGAFGLGLLLFAMGCVAIAALRQWGSATGHLSLVLFLHVLLSTLTDGGRLVTGASEFLYFFWFPLSVIIGLSLHKDVWPVRGRASTVTP